MKFKLQITSGLYSQNQHQIPMNFDYASGYPEMSCFDYESMIAYFNNLTKNIKVDNSIDDWTFSIRIYLGGAMNEKKITIPKNGVIYSSSKEKEVNIRISLPTSDEISWGITKKHRFNEYAKSGAGKGVVIILVEYNQFKSMTDYLESSIRLVIKRVLTDGVTLKGQKIKI